MPPGRVQERVAAGLRWGAVAGKLGCSEHCSRQHSLGNRAQHTLLGTVQTKMQHCPGTYLKTLWLVDGTLGIPNTNEQVPEAWLGICLESPYYDLGTNSTHRPDMR